MRIDAAELMAGGIQKLAERRPDLCNRSGFGFWPVPIYFPLILAKCLYGIQELVTELALSGDPSRSHLLVSVRSRFVELVANGDLGEDHHMLFVHDHPKISASDKGDLPFSAFCRDLLCVEDPLELLGAIVRNEFGSVAEIDRLVRTGLIADGEFSRKHLTQELAHAELAREIENLLSSEHSLVSRFTSGFDLHDQCYRTATGCSGDSAR